jgi:HAD superfamily hydrolase (TIGR01450 family)
MLRASARPLAQAYDVALLDLDGVVYIDGAPVDHAVEALAAAEAAGMRRAFVTNNALRPPGEVARGLDGLGVPATVRDVVTSAQAAGRVLADRVAAGSAVLVCGGPGLVEAVAERGLRPVTTAAENPSAVTTGYDPAMDYARLAEASLVLGTGALWVATNSDATVPSLRGRLPGAGATIAFLATAAGRDPDVVAGKPHPALHQESVQRTGARHPLVVGDRVDTDIAGAVAAGCDSLLVLTGVARLPELLTIRHRPTYLAPDLRGLLAVHPAPEATGWRVERAGDELVAYPPRSRRDGDDGLDGWRSVLAAAWVAADAGRPARGVHGLG